MRDAFNDATSHRLTGEFALTPMTDRDIERLGIFTGQGHDLADHLGSEARWRAGPWRSRSNAWPRRRSPPRPSNDAARCWRSCARSPVRPPSLPQPVRGQQNDPRSLRQLLRRRMRPDQAVQFVLMLNRQFDWRRFVCRHPAALMWFSGQLASIPDSRLAPGTQQLSSSSQCDRVATDRRPYRIVGCPP